MKTKIVLVALVLLVSCSKEKKTYCWRCEDYSYISNKIISVTNYCDMTVEEIIKHEEEMSIPGLFDYKCTKR
jgi:hypothetical protein